MMSGEEIPCPFCRCPLDTFKKMLNHVRSTHAEFAEQHWRLCQTCQCRFPDSKALQQHSYRCKSKRICQFCGDEFILIKTLDAHLKKHHLDQVKKIWIHHCAFCLEPFPTNNQLLQHLKTTHPNAHPEYVKDNWYTCTKNAEEPKEINANFNDPECLEQCPIQNEKESGDRLDLPDLPLLEAISQSSPEKRAKCPIEDCNQLFVSFRAMYSHVRSEHSTYAKDNWSACPFCEVLFPQKHIIGNHFYNCKFNKFNTFHTSAYPQLMICSQCKTGTVSFKHMYTVHKEFVEETWMKCGACETYFPDMEYLSKHWNVCEASNFHQFADENQNPIPKEVTESLKVPESYSNLKIEKVEKCPVCNETFGTFNFNHNAKSLRAKYKHMRLKHPEFIMDHWYQCGFCDQYYPNTSGLYQHKRNVHSKPDESKTPSERGSSIPDLSNDELFNDESNDSPETFETTEPFDPKINTKSAENVDEIGPILPISFKMSPIVSYEDYNEPPNTFEYIKMNESMEIENTPMDEPENPLPMVLIPDIEMKVEDEEFSEENVTDVPMENQYINNTDVPMEDRYILSECLGDINLDKLDEKLAWLKNH